MVTHKIGNIEVSPPVISWWLSVENDGRLCIVGNDGRTSQTVLTIYPSGKLYRHRNIKLIGLELGAMGKISEFPTPELAHREGGTG